MAILRVAKLGSPVLRARASEIETIDLKKGRLRGFFEDLMETMVEYNGTGLAAPQVNTSLRVVLYEVQPEGRGKIEIPPTILVNPTFEPSGDQAGEMIGSREARAACGFIPSASAICSS